MGSGRPVRYICFRCRKSAAEYSSPPENESLSTQLGVSFSCISLMDLTSTIGMSPSHFGQNSSDPISAAELPPETLNHLLSLPPLLQPISPSLAALHLARVRLFLSTPASPTTGDFCEWWCHHCGGLREGLGGGRRKRALAGPTTDKGEGRRKKAECSQCGVRYRRPKPDRKSLSQFEPARTRSRRIEKLVPEVVIATNSATSLDSNSIPILSKEQMSPTKPRPTLLSTPSLTYIPSSAPDPPTYPEPTGRPRLPSSTAGGKGGKRRKKSGLAKLLADNRERAEKESGMKSGSWGLG